MSGWLWLISNTLAYAQVFTIEITQGTVSGIPIAIVPFAMQGLSTDELQPATIIESDLGLSGRFTTIPRTHHLSRPHDLKSVNYKDWRLIKSEALVVGKITNIGNAQYEVIFRLLDVFNEKQLVGRKFVVSENKIRQASHQISDIIYNALTGRAGAFDTKIAYITEQDQKSKKKFFLQVSDSDGERANSILESSNPILSPAWSSDGNKLAYVSFEKNRSIIFIQDIWTGKREKVAEFSGINSAPAWSPDGEKLAMTLSKDGNSEIYVKNLRTGELKRITRNTAIDTEPAWSPDGGNLLFTSARSGTPQIYRVALAGGKPQRLTFTGSYNAEASYSPDGKKITFITNQGNGYKVAVYTLFDRTFRALTKTKYDESPTFAPNGDIIMYATKKAGRSVLATISSDGQIEQVLSFRGGAIREPAWSPFNRNL